MLKSKMKYHSELRKEYSNLKINFFNNPKLNPELSAFFCKLSLELTLCLEARVNLNDQSFKEKMFFLK